ncbi:MAG TPA: nitroreductase family protein [Candidatus Cloacimonadota bacterium]|nr:nitroreductase family protein [Candidatus Cloacimonadota bacterium]
MAKIKINEDKCTRCNVCASVCCMGIIEIAIDNQLPQIPREKQIYCLRCGHCEAYCKAGALMMDYNVNPEPVPSNFNIKADDVSMYFKNRRSVRHYQEKSVNNESLNKILDTIRYAASGSNSQSTGYLIYQNREDVKRISALTIDWMESILNTDHPMAKYVGNIVELWKSGIDFISHNAPHLLIAHVPLSPWVEDITDGIIALTHFDLLAPAYGLGTCWAGFIKMAYSEYKPLQQFIGLNSDRLLAYPMLFGYPVYKPFYIPERNPLQVEWR